MLKGGTLSLSFKGNSNGNNDAADASTNLENWSPSGVTLSAPDANGLRTASIPVETSVPTRFMRF